MDENTFLAGTYVVLLSSCVGGDEWGEGQGLPINYVYKLKADSNTYSFRVEVDTIGRCNGWSVRYGEQRLNKMKLRMATVREIEAYEKAGAPVPICMKNEECSYSIY